MCFLLRLSGVELGWHTESIVSDTGIVFVVRNYFHYCKHHDCTGETTVLPVGWSHFTQLRLEDMAEVKIKI